MAHPIHDMFFLSWPLILEKMFRPLVIYFFLIIVLRLAGKRELAQLNPFDLIVLLTLSNTVQNAIIGDDNSLSGGMLGAATLLLLNYMFVRFIHGHRKLETLFEGHRDFLIHNGLINHAHLKKEMLTRAELVAAAHRQGIGSLAEVDTAVLEPTGVITFVTKHPTEDEKRHHELMDAIEVLKTEIDSLRGTKPAT